MHRLLGSAVRWLATAIQHVTSLQIHSGSSSTHFLHRRGSELSTIQQRWNVQMMVGRMQWYCSLHMATRTQLDNDRLAT